MTFLTTCSGLVGDAARMSGYAVVSLFKALSTLEQRFAVRVRVVFGRWGEGVFSLCVKMKRTRGRSIS